jgi:hypothetical protein
MAYFMINGVDYSKYVNELKVKKAAKYSSQTNAAGNTTVDIINSKYTVKVGIIALDSSVMPQIQEAINGFAVAISFRDPHTNELKEINCLIAGSEVDYYTIQADKVMFNGFDLTFTEL